MSYDYDVIIIGAGPAGSSCAKNLIENNRKVLLIEREKLPRYKCCSGLYSKRAISIIEKIFGKIPSELWCENKKVTVKVSKTGEAGRFFPLNQFQFYNLKRADVDYWLSNKSGADIVDQCLFISYEKKQDQYVIKCRKNNEYINFSCKNLVIATGARSKYRKKLDNNYKEEDFHFAYQKVFTGNFGKAEKKYYYVIPNHKYSKYFASMMIKDNFLYIVTSIDKKKQYFQDLYELLKNEFKLDVKEVRKEGSYSEYYKEGKNFFYGYDDILFIGESTGMISVFSEGIGTAIITGENAAKAILEFDKKDLLKKYTEICQEEVDYIRKAWKIMNRFNR